MTDAEILAALDAQLDDDAGTCCGEDGCSDPAVSRIVHRCGGSGLLMCRVHALRWWSLFRLFTTHPEAKSYRCRGCAVPVSAMDRTDWSEEAL